MGEGEHRTGDLGLPSIPSQLAHPPSIAAPARAPAPTSSSAGSLAHNTRRDDARQAGREEVEQDDRPSNPKRHTLTRRISFPDDQLDFALLARLRRWVLTFAVVEFDVDTGPNLDNAYPLVRFPPSVKSNIAFSSLPEGDLPSLSPPSSYSAPNEEREPAGYAYHWRIPYPSERELRQAEAEEEKQGRGRKEFYRLPRSAEGEEAQGDGALHGYVWFLQEKDERLRRGYSQRSLVLITHLPSLSGLFSSALAVIAPLHFKHAKQRGAKGGMVESACYNISAWPDPIPGSTLDLPLLGTVLTFALPLPSQAQFPSLPPLSASLTSSVTPRGGRRAATYPLHPPSPFLSSAAFAPPTGPPPVLPAALPLTPLCALLFPPFSPSGNASGKVGAVGFTKLLLLWELLVLGEPLLVYVRGPREGAEVVEGLRRLVLPIPFAGDVRPYFHVHDRDFAVVCKTGGKPPPGTIIASTNPLVLRHSRTWPHVLNLCRSSATFSSSLPNSTSTSSLSRSGSIRATDESKEFGLMSERKRHVKKDEKTAKAVEEAWARGDYQTCDLLLYQHFASLTERFLAPLNRYFGTLWAGSGGLAPGADGTNGFGLSAAPGPLLSPGPSPLPSTRFSPPAFLASLRTHGSSLPLKPSAPSFSQPSTTPIERFYARFLRPENPHAAAWLEERTRAVGGEVRKRYLKRLEEVDMRSWVDGKAEEEVDEMVGRLEREAGRLTLNSAAPSRASTTPVPSSSATSRQTPSSSYSSTSAGLGISSPSSSTAFSSSASAAYPPSPSASPAPSSPSLTAEPASLLQPGARLLKQAERLRSLRDERVRSSGGSWYASSTGGSSTGGEE